MWLVDLAQLPQGALLGRLLAVRRARPSRRPDVTRFATTSSSGSADQGIDVSGDRIVMLANPRMLGYVFNPITVYWCLAGDTNRACVVAEVHNTYGGRHCYLLTPDAAGRASVDKALYVSPFNPVDGSYDMRFTLPTDLVHVGIILRREGAGAVQRNSERVPRSRSPPRRRCARVLHYPLGALRVTALIRYQGIRLFLRGLPVVRRPTDARTPDRDEMPGVTTFELQPRPASIRTGRTLDATPRRPACSAPRGGRPADLHAEQLRGSAWPSSCPTDGCWSSRRRARQQRRGTAACRPVMRLHRPAQFFRRLGHDGLIGFGESYMAGDWDADDVARVLTPFARRMAGLVPGVLQRARRWYDARQPASEHNDLRGSKSNISRHYDLSNELFALFLDRTMTYSSAIWDDAAAATR